MVFQIDIAGAGGLVIVDECEHVNRRLCCCHQD
jgi:hypothetical protein